MTFKDGSKGAERGYAPPPKRPEMAQNEHIHLFNRKREQLFYIKHSLYYLLLISKRDPIIFSEIGYLFETRSRPKPIWFRH